MERKFVYVLLGEYIYKGCLFFGYLLLEILDVVKNFNVREDDVFIVMYLKVGIFFFKLSLVIEMNK